MCAGSEKSKWMVEGKGGTYKQSTPSINGISVILEASLTPGA